MTVCNREWWLVGIADSSSPWSPAGDRHPSLGTKSLSSQQVLAGKGGEQSLDQVSFQERRRGSKASALTGPGQAAQCKGNTDHLPVSDPGYGMLLPQLPSTRPDETFAPYKVT